MNEDHFALLERVDAVAAWNAWRYENPNIRPDLSGAELNDSNYEAVDFRLALLEGADLRFSVMSGAALRGADLEDADMSHVRLDNADLQGARLLSAQLVKASLQSADLREARLDFANLRDANLRQAQLRGASLAGASLVSTDLREADLSYAKLHNTTLVNTALPQSVLEADISSCFVDWRTVARSRHIDQLELVLQRCGTPDAVAVALVATMRAMTDEQVEALLMPIWIAHGPRDRDLANRVRSGLEARGFKTWFYRAADGQFTQIDLRVSRFDRMVLICTASALRHDSLDYELQTMLECDMHVGGGDIIVPVVAEADLFKAVEPDGTPAWWCEPQADCVHAALYARPYIDVVDAINDERKWAIKLDEIDAQLRLPVDKAAKCNAGFEHTTALRRRKGLE